MVYIMIRLQRNIPFKLPRLGSDTFSKLMRAKLKYDKKNSTFEITDDTEITSIISILSNVLNKEVVLELECIICSKSTNCAECEYADVCDRSKVSSYCICRECIDNGDAYENYKKSIFKRLKLNDIEG